MQVRDGKRDCILCKARSDLIRHKVMLVNSEYKCGKYQRKEQAYERH